MQRYTPAKVRRALARRLRVLVATQSRARKAEGFRSLSDLRAYALTAAGDSNSFEFTVQTGLSELPLQARLGLAGIKKLNQSFEDGKLQVKFQLAQPISTGQAWLAWSTKSPEIRV